MLYCTDADTVADPTDADITGAGGKMHYDLARQVVKKGIQNIDEMWNDPKWLQENSNFPLLGPIFKTRYQELYNAEEKRYYNDLYRNTGTSGSQYWTRRGENRLNPVTAGDYFEVTDAIMSLYGGKKW